MNFVVDSRIATSCFILIDWPLSRVFLKNNADYPRLILVPRVLDAVEIHQLSVVNRHQLIDEISALSSIVKTYFKADKLNIGSLGNIVSQLHVHVVARNTCDELWPQSVWQASLKDKPYVHPYLDNILNDLRLLVSQTSY